MYQITDAALALDQLAAFDRLIGKADLKPGPGGSHMAPVDQIAVRAVLQGLLAGEWSQAMWVLLMPSAQIVAHTDRGALGLRTHIPLRQNASCWCFHDGVWQQLDRGQVYTMDAHRPHGAVNWGTTPRVHLMLESAATLS